MPLSKIVEFAVVLSCPPEKVPQWCNCILYHPYEEYKAAIRFLECQVKDTELLFTKVLAHEHTTDFLGSGFRERADKPFLDVKR